MTRIGHCREPAAAVESSIDTRVRQCYAWPSSTVRQRGRIQTTEDRRTSRQAPPNRLPAPASKKFSNMNTLAPAQKSLARSRSARAGEGEGESQGDCLPQQHETNQPEHADV